MMSRVSTKKDMDDPKVNLSKQINDNSKTVENTAMAKK